MISFALKIAVVALHVFLGMGKTRTGNEQDTVLVWGVGGWVGAYAVQYAKCVSNLSNAVPSFGRFSWFGRLATLSTQQCLLVI